MLSHGRAEKLVINTSNFLRRPNMRGKVPHIIRAPLPTETTKKMVVTLRWYAPHLTSTPPRSKTPNNLRSDTRAELTPITDAQNIAPSSSASVCRGACYRRSRLPGATQRRSIKARVTTSDTGEIRIGGACSYDASGRKRSAMYACLSKSGS